jgi:dTMP kinase
LKPLFIVFEGIDGSGTSTQAALLRDWYIANGQAAALTSEPSSGPIGNLIREGMKHRVVFAEGQDSFDQQMAYLFAADRHDHLYNPVDGVMAMLSRKVTVLSTRYWFSSLAYHCSSPRDEQFVTFLNSRFPQPDALIYIDTPVAVSLARLGHRGFRDAYENEAKLVRVRERYEHIVSHYAGTCLRVRGNEDRDVVHRQIVTFVGEVQRAR